MKQKKINLRDMTLKIIKKQDKQSIKTKKKKLLKNEDYHNKPEMLQLHCSELIFKNQKNKKKNQF